MSQNSSERCRFCEVVAAPLASNALAYAIRDGNPVTPLHTLIIPRRHVESFFDLHGAEQNAIFALLDEMRSDIQQKDPTVEGFNIGVNNGEVAGQSVPHVHVHLIPRRRGDVENPRGGVRGVIPRSEQSRNSKSETNANDKTQNSKRISRQGAKTPS